MYLLVVADETGSVVQCNVLSGDEPFVTAGVALKRWRYEPKVIDGKVVRWKALVHLTFKLR